MKCINMFNSDQCSPPPLSSPRISFSNDFAVDQPSQRAPAQPADTNFEFSVGSHQMMAADQLFFKGRLLPLKDNRQYCNASGGGRWNRTTSTTLRDELLSPSDGDEDEDYEQRPSSSGKVSIKWKELLGIKKKGHCNSAAKKVSCKSNEGALDQITAEAYAAEASLHRRSKTK